MAFSKKDLLINPAKEAERLTANLKDEILNKLKKRGAVIGISGGVDSSVTLALCVKALGPQHVLGLILPEKDSSPDSTLLAQKVAKFYGIDFIVEDLTEALTGLGCYRRRDEAIKKVFPEYDNTYKAKITLPGNLLQQDSLNVFHLTIISPDGTQKSQRIPIREYLQIVAASNFKQRTRMGMLYYHAESRNYAVVGTGNKNEHEHGFFVKYGDGGTDIRPITHLFKTQVYQLAEYLQVPDEICKRIPTSDTYSAEQTQEEFFFRLPFEILDTIWYGWEKGASIDEISQTLELEPGQVENVIHDIKRKISATQYLRMPPIHL